MDVIDLELVREVVDVEDWSGSERRDPKTTQFCASMSKLKRSEYGVGKRSGCCSVESVPLTKFHEHCERRNCFGDTRTHTREDGEMVVAFLDATNPDTKGPTSYLSPTLSRQTAETHIEEPQISKIQVNCTTANVNENENENESTNKFGESHAPRRATN